MSNIRDIKLIKVKVQMDKERSLNYDLNALAELEEKFGTIENAFNALQNQKIKDIITLLWAGLIHEDEALTEKEAGALVSFAQIPVLAEIITEALMVSIPKEATSE